VIATNQLNRVGSMAVTALGVCAGAILFAYYANVSIPALESGRTVFFALTLIGLTMCALGMHLPTYGWLNPFNVAGVVLGVLLLALTGVVLLGLEIPVITTYRAAINTLAALVAVKIVLAVARGRTYGTRV